jgi:predicted nucleotidyltransferase component of viral defense system
MADSALELAAVREALQSRLLVELMSAAIQKEFVLKGGMAMRAVHGSVRYTKDIDLDADPKYSTSRLQGIVRRAIQRALSSGLIEDPVVTEPKQTQTTLRWKISGTQAASHIPVNLTVEVSRRSSSLAAHVIEKLLPSSFGDQAGVKIQVLDSQAIAVTKIQALIDPHRQAPRDLFDLHVLIEAGIPDPADLLAELPNAATFLPSALAELWQKIEAMTYQQFVNEVIPYLPASTAEAIDEKAFDDMRITVATRVETWLKAAAESTSNLSDS